MKLALRSPDKRRDIALPGVHGVARVDRRVPRLLGRLNPGDIAVIDVQDLDRTTADALVGARVAAVVNISASMSGRYPTLGPRILLTHQIPLLDSVGPEVLSVLKEGTRVRLDGSSLLLGDALLAEGVRQSEASVAADMSAARAGLAAQLQAFAANTQLHMQAEHELLLDGLGIPAVRTKLAGRHIVLVARGYDFTTDIKGLKHFIREFRPVLIGVDGGADVLRQFGYRADIVVGSAEFMSDPVLREATDVVLRGDHQGRVPGLARVQDLGIEALIFTTAGTSDDAAMLLAEAGQARLLVTVGMRATLEEFLDSSRGGIASTVLTRLRVGGRLIDAKAAAMLYQNRITPLTAVLVVLAALLAVGAVLYSSSAGEDYANLLSDGWNQARTWVEGLFG